ncbi:MAG: 3-oxoacyl-[acyl-carrier-protein] reductase [Candidatus Hydrogenedentes bacterium]|nr:3-oxoacyl-[acyl-carrier-protein] reductase [Candidatus Hydrogenedentota bacterium]
MKAFDGKVVLITGGTRGIGRACAERFASEGARVALCGRSADTAAAAAEAIAAATGADVRGVEADIADPDAVKALIDTVTAAFGKIDVLVNNAGITRDGLILRMKDDDWGAVIDADLTGVFYCCRAVARGMLKQRSGRIINVSSVIGLHGQAGQCNYASAKAGLVGLTKSLAGELASRAITANVVAPGYIETDMTAVLADATRAAIIERVPLGRPGAAEDVANAIRFLASEEAAYITGAVIQVDGGLAM